MLGIAVGLRDVGVDDIDCWAIVEGSIEFFDLLFLSSAAIREFEGFEFWEKGREDANDFILRHHFEIDSASFEAALVLDEAYDLSGFLVGDFALFAAEIELGFFRFEFGLRVVFQCEHAVFVYFVLIFEP